MQEKTDLKLPNRSRTERLFQKFRAFDTHTLCRRCKLKICVVPFYRHSFFLEPRKTFLEFFLRRLKTFLATCPRRIVLQHCLTRFSLTTFLESFLGHYSADLRGLSQMTVQGGHSKTVQVGLRWGSLPLFKENLLQSFRKKPGQNYGKHQTRSSKS